MHRTKEKLIEKNGMRCMLCLKEFPYWELEWHHIVPKSVSHRQRKRQDDSYDNGAILCLKCHKIVHKYSYQDKRYQDLMRVIRKHKK